MVEKRTGVNISTSTTLRIKVVERFTFYNLGGDLRRSDPVQPEREETP